MFEEPFGPALFAGITDLDLFRRNTIRDARLGIDVRAHRAAAAARPILYHGGPVTWETPQLAEAA